jgi:hypothetical protein
VQLLHPVERVLLAREVIAKREVAHLITAQWGVGQQGRGKACGRGGASPHEQHESSMGR